ncbi:YdeI family protein [Klenkia sp. PcliD-1-E]|uniref:YdeI/OmpD-associated family protein n=1 Tax=Klenkia sp. PcliD-1-E TaxID=2954492 RepID=UPI002097BDE8|nr:YdeI/OmpD-associated family protein [Klenkia sp. PcliD-1-E]MCO7221086.1 YdeI/OmpD-associated family protein [Klenkia sp. PcliD-1-E]
MEREFEMRMFADGAELDVWLTEHGGEAPGLYVRLAKKGASFPSVTWEELVEGLLCHGWIDGRANRLDEESWTIRVTPRRPRSIWSAKNVATVARLVEQGRMRPAGLAQVEAAQADGRWAAAYPGSAAMPVPEDLAAALSATPGAWQAFDALDAAGRYAVLHRVHTKRTAAGRAATIADLVDRVATGKRL